MPIFNQEDVRVAASKLIKSGTDYGNAGTEKTVTFPEPFVNKPDIVLTPWGNYHVWITTIWKGQFKFLNDHDSQVQVDWVAVDLA